MTMIPEKIYKQNLIQSLNSIGVGWIDGDKEINKKNADMVNHALKIAIEIKDDTIYKLETPPPGIMINQGYDLKKMNQRFADHIRSANNKFKEYPNYKTIFLLRTEFPIMRVVRYVIEGLDSYVKNSDGHLVYAGKVGKYSKYNKQEIGCFLVIENDGYYFPNVFARPNRTLTKEEVRKIFGYAFKDPLEY